MGDCFEAAAKVALGWNDAVRVAPGDMTLVHAWVDGQGKLEGRRMEHAWVETRHGVAIDFSNGRSIVVPTFLYRRAAGRITGERRYASTEVRTMLLENPHWGPWEPGCCRPDAE